MSDKKTRAREIMTQMLGADVAAQLDKPRQEAGFAPELMQMIVEHAFEDLWARPGLSPRDRSLLTIGILMTLRADGELRFHIPAGIRNGLTKDEIAEIIYHVSGYAGFPAGVNGREIASQVLAD